MSSCCVAAALGVPPPEEKEGEFKNFKRIAIGRAIYDPNAKAIECTPGTDAVAKGLNPMDVCRMQCEFDFTCKGFNVWKEIIDQSAFGLDPLEKYWVIKTKTAPDPWTTIPAYFVGKEDSKIYLRINQNQNASLFTLPTTAKSARSL